MSHRLEQLNCYGSNAAGSAVDENGLSLRQLHQFKKVQPNRKQGFGKSGRRKPIQLVQPRKRESRGGRDVLRVAPSICERDNLLTQAARRDVRSTGDDPARYLKAGDWIQAIPGTDPALVTIVPVDAGSDDFDENLIGLRVWHCNLPQHQCFRSARGRDFDSTLPGRERHGECPFVLSRVTIARLAAQVAQMI
jgi:hypothetical protein